MEKILPYRVLLIDDEERLVFGLKTILEREGCLVYTANSGIQGLRMARQHLPDMILCDVMMPAPNGIQLKKTLMEDRRTAAIPFFFITARSGEEDIVAGLKIGADDYITKPFNIEELLARMQAVMRRKR
ncbi:MAG: response regulator [Chloroflexota bacterium]|jgi:two-component system alkaline phosphatase synthesis response regulator PhoP